MVDTTKTVGELVLDGYTEPARANLTFLKEQKRIAKEKVHVVEEEDGE